MTDEGLEELIRSLESEINKGYSPEAVEHAMNPRNLGWLEGADAEGRFTGSCGDTMVIWLDISDGVIEKANFWTDGCGPSIASGSIITTMATGKSLDEARQISKKEVLRKLGGLPEESEHCAELAATALNSAIDDSVKEESG